MLVNLEIYTYGPQLSLLRCTSLSFDERPNRGYFLLPSSVLCHNPPLEPVPRNQKMRQRRQVTSGSWMEHRHGGRWASKNHLEGVKQALPHHKILALWGALWDEWDYKQEVATCVVNTYQGEMQDRRGIHIKGAEIFGHWGSPLKSLCSWFQVL